MIVYINGRFLSQRLTGVQRFAREITKAIDEQWEQWRGIDFRLVVPDDYDKSFRLDHIKIDVLPGKGGYYWEQIRLPRFIKKAKAAYLVSLCNVAPLRLKRKNIVCIHDLAVVYHPETYSKAFVLVYRFLYKRQTKKSALILTVTGFSKKQIEERYSVPAGKIQIVNNAVSESFGLDKTMDVSQEVSAILEKPFFFSVGSASPNKNMKYVYACAKANPDVLFAISGDKNKVFSQVEQVSPLPNVVYLGYVNDRELRLLYSHCQGFIFPSFYEGFGIPPIEAIACGCDTIIASDIPVLREVLGRFDINYIDPHDYEHPIDLQRPLVKNANKSLGYRWRDQAAVLIDRISFLGEDNNG